MTSKKIWISSNESKKIAKIKGCDLMHYRLEGRLEYQKVGNSFLYEKESILKLK